MQDPKSIAITGGSSGIGAALARAYAAPGVSLALAGRDGPRLEAVAAACRAAGAVVTGTRVEVTDRGAVARWIAAADRAAPLDLVIANAGTSAGTASGGESDYQTRAIFAVNLEGVMNTVLPAVAALRGRRRGQVAIMSSLAGFRGFPGAPAYCASKAAVRVWGESLRGHLAPEGIGVTVICPGFVKSPMTAVNQFPMPLLVDSDAAARRIKRGLARNRARISFPRPLAAAIWLLGALPPAWTDPLLAKLPEKR
jgi:short-subunit dehydrogenase